MNYLKPWVWDRLRSWLRSKKQRWINSNAMSVKFRINKSWSRIQNELQNYLLPSFSHNLRLFIIWSIQMISLLCKLDGFYINISSGRGVPKLPCLGWFQTSNLDMEWGYKGYPWSFLQCYFICYDNCHNKNRFTITICNTPKVIIDTTIIRSLSH